MIRRLDPATTAGALALLVIGLFLLLDSTDAIDLTSGWALSLLLAAGGATLLASGGRPAGR